MKQFERILIIGNSGSGKTWLGNALFQSKQIPLFHMDNIRWDQSGYEIRRSAADIERDLEAIKNQDAALSLQLAGYFYQGSFQNIGIIIIAFIFLTVLTLFFVIKNCELMKFAREG
jgi:adenylate kinase family enzyme